MKSWPSAGIIYCNNVQAHCAYVDTETGGCKRERCNVNDQEYIERQRKIRDTMQFNHMDSLGRKPESKPVIRNQSKSLEHIKELIERKEHLRDYYYKTGKPKIADRIHQEIIKLQKEKEQLQPAQSQRNC